MSCLKAPLRGCCANQTSLKVAVSGNNTHLDTYVLYIRCSCLCNSVDAIHVP